MNRIRTFLGAALGLFGLTVTAAADDAKPAPPDVEVTYELYFLGIPLGEIGFSANIQGKNYTALSTLATEGIVNAFWHARIQATTRGVLDGEHAEPSLYYSTSQYGKTVQHVTLTYPASGPPTFVADPKITDELSLKMADAFKENTLDPVSAMVTLATSVGANETKPCGVSLPIYDARRRYDVALSYVKTAKVSTGLYAGPAELCAIGYHPLAGPKQEVMNVRRTPPMYAWLVPVRDPADGSRVYMVPLRIWVETTWGNGTALISEIKLAGNKIAKLN
jgi:hypothetical protein